MSDRVVMCVLKSGPEYGPGEVESLRDNLRKHSSARLVCLSDVPVPCERIQLQHDWPGWWSKLELFRFITDQPVLYVDLDTRFIADPEPLFRREFTMLENGWRPGDVGSGMMSWQGDYSHLYSQFRASSGKFISEYRTTAKWGDQGFIRDHIGLKPKLYRRDEAASYKLHCTAKGAGPYRLPHPSVRVVYWHGKPRPWEVPPIPGA